MDIMFRAVPCSHRPTRPAPPVVAYPCPGEGPPCIRAEPEHGLEAVAMSVMSEMLSRD